MEGQVQRAENVLNLFLQADFMLKGSFVLTAQPQAIDIAFGSQLCPGACLCPFFLFWPWVS